LATYHSYIFYTSDGLTQAPDGTDIENCQLLGYATATNQNEAMDILIKDNPWIREHQYSLSHIKAISVANT